MAAPTLSTCIEYTNQEVQMNGLNTLENINFNGGSNTCDLPSSTTINGASVAGIGVITSSSATLTAFSVTNSGVFTGTNVMALVADSATTGTIFNISGAGLTSGHALVITAAGTLVSGGDALSVIANSATTSTGVVRISTTGLVSGFSLSVTSGGANLTTGGVATFLMGAATAGIGVKVSTTGVYTDTLGVLQVTANAATSGSVAVINTTGITTGKSLVIANTAATLTTGRYISLSDSATEVLGIGANGHIHTTQTTAPTIATNATGISACAITAGSTDVCGQLTTTGTPQSGTVLTVTFNKTYTTAPKFVAITPINAAGGGVNTVPYVSSITATTFVLTWPAGGTYAATPSFAYYVIA